MKKMIVVAALLMFTICHGQTTLRLDSILKAMKDSGVLTMPVGSFYGLATGIVTSVTQPHESKRDTVPVILIEIDTNTGMVSTAYFFHPLSQAQNDSRIPYWIRGYSVRQQQWIEDCRSCRPYWETLFYLDEYKRPLSPDIIVCQSFGGKIN